MTRTNATTLNLLVLRTTIPARLTAFYQCLGLNFREEQHGNGPLHHSAQAGDCLLEIYTATEKQPTNANLRLGFTVGDLDAVIASLRGFDVEVINEPRQTEWGLRAVVRDPDGRTVELYQGAASPH